MRFHLVHVPGVPDRIDLPFMLIHKLSMLIAHAVRSENDPLTESMDVRANGIVLQGQAGQVAVILKDSNLLLFVEGPQGPELLKRTYEPITGDPFFIDLLDFLSEDWPGLKLKEQVLCPTCLPEVAETAGYWALGAREAPVSCKRNKTHKEVPSTLAGK